MKRIISLKYLLPVFAIIVFTIIYTISCKKENQECKALITIKLLSDPNKTIDNAIVIIAPQYPYVCDTGISDASGQVTFTFKKEGILDVYATKNIGGDPDSLSGQGVVKLEPGETVDQVVYVD